MLGLLIFFGIILVLILINKNTKSSPEGPGCIEQGCLALIIMFVIGVVVPDCAQRQHAERRLERRTGIAATPPQVTFTEATIWDSLNSKEHRAFFGRSTPKIFVNCRVSGARIGMAITGKWYLNGPQGRELLAEATVHPTTTNQAVYFSATKPQQDWPLGQYSVVLLADGVERQTVNFTVKP